MIQQLEIIAFKKSNGVEPFYKWLYKQDPTIIAKIEDRIDDLARGVFGDHKYLGNNVYELRDHKGPGYRIYFGKIGTTIVILLHGGTKGTQDKDIEKAKQYFLEYKETKYEQIKQVRRKETRVTH